MQTDSTLRHCQADERKSKHFKAGLLIVITALATSSEGLEGNSAVLVKAIPAEQSQSARTAVANTVVPQQCTSICSPNRPYLSAFNASWGKKHLEGI